MRILAGILLSMVAVTAAADWRGVDLSYVSVAAGPE